MWFIPIIVWDNGHIFQLYKPNRNCKNFCTPNLHANCMLPHLYCIKVCMGCLSLLHPFNVEFNAIYKIESERKSERGRGWRNKVRDRMGIANKLNFKGQFYGGEEILNGRTLCVRVRVCGFYNHIPCSPNSIYHPLFFSTFSPSIYRTVHAYTHIFIRRICVSYCGRPLLIDWLDDSRPFKRT